MKKLRLTILFLCITFFAFAQYQVTIEATIFDNQSKHALPYVNIEFVNTNIKTISDNHGHFTLVYDEVHIREATMFKCSSLGYKTIVVTASELFKFLKNTNKIYLVPNGYTANNEKQVEQSKNVKVKDNIYGTVTSNSKPVQMATIRVKNRYTETQTNAEGNYSINAKEDDVLVLNYLGMVSKEVQVGSTNNINIALEPDGELLDEVLLEGQAKKEEVIHLGKGEAKSFDAIGTSVNVISAKDIKPNMYDIKDLLYGKFAGMNNMKINTMGPDPGLPKIMLRGNGSVNNGTVATYDIDGAFYSFESSGTIPNINPQDIESISILKSLAATTKYGTLGRGGVIVIRTKINGFDKAKKKTQSLLVIGNDYSDSLVLPRFSKKKTNYIIELEKAKSFQEAVAIYNTQKAQSTQLTIPYLIGVSNYFDKWDKVYADTVLSSISNLAYNNAKALKTLAYTLESQGKLEEAKEVYQRIVILQPKAAQSYRDLALIYVQTGNYEEAMSLYGQMLNNTIEDLDFSGLKEVITNELKHLLAKHRSKINYSNVHADYLQTNFKYDLRIVFDWNDTSAEFEVQFVNPKKKFFKWSQTQFDNKAKMLEGITKGYHTEEFIIDDDEAGEWIINIESLNEEPPLNPTYLKYTVYRNYGLVNETKEVRVVKLNDFNTKASIDKLSYN